LMLLLLTEINHLVFALVERSVIKWKAGLLIRPDQALYFGFC